MLQRQLAMVHHRFHLVIARKMQLPERLIHLDHEVNQGLKIIFPEIHQLYLLLLVRLMTHIQITQYTHRILLLH